MMSVPSRLLPITSWEGGGISYSVIPGQSSKPLGESLCTSPEPGALFPSWNQETTKSTYTLVLAHAHTHHLPFLMSSLILMSALCEGVCLCVCELSQVFFFTPFISPISWYPIGSYSLVSSLKLLYGLGRGEGQEPSVLRNTTLQSSTAS
jgi:hypothetical protein